MWAQSIQSASFQPQAPAGRLPFDTNDAVFKAAWNALRFSGSQHIVPDAGTHVRGLYPATVALCRALWRRGRSLWIEPSHRPLFGQGDAWGQQGFLTTNPKSADFTLVPCPSRMPTLYSLNIGDGRDPATATTLLIQVPAIGPERDMSWTQTKQAPAPQQCIPGLSPTFLQQRAELQEMLPWGIDIFFIHGHRFVALPRTVAITTVTPA